LLLARLKTTEENLKKANGERDDANKKVTDLQKKLDDANTKSEAEIKKLQTEAQSGSSSKVSNSPPSLQQQQQEQEQKSTEPKKLTGRAPVLIATSIAIGATVLAYYYLWLRDPPLININRYLAAI